MKFKKGDVLCYRGRKHEIHKVVLSVDEDQPSKYKLMTTKHVGSDPLLGNIVWLGSLYVETMYEVQEG